MPSSPRNPAGRRRRTASGRPAPTTIVGSTNGTVTSARSAVRPRKRQAIQHVCPRQAERHGAAPADAAACQTVNSAIRCTRGLPSTSSDPWQVERSRPGSAPDRSVIRPGRRRTARTSSPGRRRAGPSRRPWPADRDRRRPRAAVGRPTAAAGRPVGERHRPSGRSVVAVIARLSPPTGRTSWRSTASRLAAIVAGSRVAGLGATGAYCCQAAGSGSAPFTG